MTTLLFPLNYKYLVGYYKSIYKMKVIIRTDNLSDVLEYFLDFLKL